MAAKMKIGILSAGGDCPGINAAIRGVGKTALLNYGMEVIGFNNGFSGLIANDFRSLDEASLSGILTMGGTVLGTSRVKPFKSTDENDLPNIICDNYRSLGLDALVCIGGNGTQRTASMLSDIGLNIVGVPKTIDNDVWGTDTTFGFDTAVNIASEAIDRLHTTANSHRRVMVIEVMGHNAGWLALYSGLASGGDVILIPELEYDLEAVCERLVERSANGKPCSIVVVAEGLQHPHPNKKTAGAYITKKIKKMTDLDTREANLGYILRGGAPSPADRILATRYGTKAATLINEGRFGVMVSMQQGSISQVPLSDVCGKLRLVAPDDKMVLEGRMLGVCFGRKPGEPQAVRPAEG